MTELAVDLVFFVGAPVAFSAAAFLGKSWEEIKKYFESGTVANLTSSPESKALVVQTGVGDLNAVDGLLVGGGTAGLLLLMIPGPTRWVGAATLLGSFLLSQTRNNAKLIGVTSTALALTITNPVAAASAGLGFLGAAASATAQSMGAAFQLSTTVVGVVVTTSGAVVGYLLTQKKPSKKRKNP